jgi:hypothetical protein
MATCNQGFPFCEDCANQDNPEGECDVCDDGDNFDPLHYEDAKRELSRIIHIKEAA